MINELEEIIKSLADCSIEFGNLFDGNLVCKTITIFEKGVSFTYKCRFVYPSDFSYVCYALQTEKYTVNDLMHPADFQSILYQIEDRWGRSIDEFNQ